MIGDLNEAKSVLGNIAAPDIEGPLILMIVSRRVAVFWMAFACSFRGDAS